MSKFQSFLKGNVKEIENETIKLERFEEDVVLRPLFEKESGAIQDTCFKNVAGKKGKPERVFDLVKYNRKICVASVVYPDLNDLELQDSYEVRGAENLYSKMFLLGEANQILEKVSEISKIGESYDEVIEEAKN